MKRALAAAFLLYFLVLTATAHAFEGHKAAVWTEAGLRYKIDKKLAVDGRGYWRMEDFLSATDKVMAQISLRFRARKRLRFNAGYRFIEEVDKEGDFETAHRFFLDATLRKRLKALTLSYRLRLQRQGDEGFGEQESRVRNKLALKWRASKRWRPLISTEHFYTGDEKEWVHTRFRNTAGVELHFGDHVFSLLYRHNLPIDDKDGPLTHILGLGYGVDFG
jgi:hypothetical protein